MRKSEIKLDMKKYIIGCLVIVCCFQGVNVKGQYTTTGSSISTKDAALILKHHNQARALLGVAPLTWNNELSAYAQEWANYLVYSNNNEIEHRSSLGKNTRDFGENIFWGSNFDSFSVLNASESWYEEKGAYIYQPVSYSNFHGTGHYTQMVWGNTKQIGVGVAKGTDGSIIVVANYYPAGNVIGMLPY
jgi:pathogenesis-related protein 1